MKIKLTKRNYTGEGYWHYFKHLETGEVIREETIKSEYEKLGEKGGAKYNPIKDGYKHTHSAGGEVNVDTPDKKLGDNEYVERPDGLVFVNVKGRGIGRGKREDIINNEIEI